MNQTNRDPNDSNKGLDTRKFLISVLVALVVILVASLVVVKSRQKTIMRGIAHPNPTSATTPE